MEIQFLFDGEKVKPPTLLGLAALCLKMQVCKPGSVSLPLSWQGSYHLSKQSTHSDIRFHDIGSSTQDRNLFDLTTRKVCQATNVTVGTVGSYATFSPFPCATRHSG